MQSRIPWGKPKPEGDMTALDVAMEMDAALVFLREVDFKVFMISDSRFTESSDSMLLKMIEELGDLLNGRLKRHHDKFQKEMDEEMDEDEEGNEDDN